MAYGYQEYPEEPQATCSQRELDDLLAAARAAHKMLTVNCGVPDSHEVAQQIEAAIARAEGEETT